MKERGHSTIAGLMAAALIVAFSALAGCRPPLLASGTLTPAAGGEATFFTYAVHYYDRDGHGPVQIEAVVDGTVYSMDLASGLPHDGVYQFRTSLSLGEHTYHFFCADGHDGTARLPAVGEIEGPSVLAEFSAFSFTSSGCLGTGEEDPGQGGRSTCEGIGIWTEGDDIVMEHLGAMYNCCTGMIVDLEALSGVFRLTEREEFPEHPCFCECPYDLSARIEDVLPGMYRVEVWDPTESVLLCTKEVAIREFSYTSTPWEDCSLRPSFTAQREDCEPGVTIHAERDTVSLEHLGAIYNCCAEMEVELITVGSTIKFVEVETFPIEPCSCICPFDITADVHDVAPGAYWVEVWDETFTHLYCREQVVVGGA